MTNEQIRKLMSLLETMTDDQLYEAVKLVTRLVGIRHTTRVLQGKEIRPGKRGKRWKKTAE